MKGLSQASHLSLHSLHNPPRTGENRSWHYSLGTVDAYDAATGFSVVAIMIAQSMPKGTSVMLIELLGDLSMVSNPSSNTTAADISIAACIDMCRLTSTRLDSRSGSASITTDTAAY